MKQVSRIADKALNKLLGVVDAGACVPSNGTFRYCRYDPNQGRYVR